MKIKTLMVIRNALAEAYINKEKEIENKQREIGGVIVVNGFGCPHYFDEDKAYKIHREISELETELQEIKDVIDEFNEKEWV